MSVIKELLHKVKIVEYNAGKFVKFIINGVEHEFEVGREYLVEEFHLDALKNATNVKFEHLGSQPKAPPVVAEDPAPVETLPDAKQDEEAPPAPVPAAPETPKVEPEQAPTVDDILAQHEAAKQETDTPILPDTALNPTGPAASNDPLAPENQVQQPPEAPAPAPAPSVEPSAPPANETATAATPAPTELAPAPAPAEPETPAPSGPPPGDAGSQAPSGN